MAALDGGVPVRLGGGACCLRLPGESLGGSQLGGHLLGGGVSVGAPLVGLGGALLGGGRAGLGGRGALLGGGPDGFDLGLGGGRVGHRVDGLAEPAGDVGDPVGFGAQQAQQFRAGHLGHRHRVVGVGRASGPGLGGGQAAALAPGRHAGVPASFAVLRRAARPGRGGGGLGAAGVLAHGPGRRSGVSLAIGSPSCWLVSSLPYFVTFSIYMRRNVTKRSN